jgi:hypothetical protein
MTITCKTRDSLALDKITEFQGQLKTRNETDLKKIKKSLKKYGISFPFFIWKKGRTNYCLDGHGRRLALLSLREEGWEIPPIPIVCIFAEDEADAKQKMLRLNSRYGMVTKDSVLQFVGDIEVDYNDLAIPGPANMFFDALVHDINNYFNEIPEGDNKQKQPVKTCPHCGKILPKYKEE